MTDEKLLEAVKTGLGFTGAFQDQTLTEYIQEVKEYLLDAGVAESVVNSEASVGVIRRGVSDLWNYGSANFSEYFKERVVQLRYKDVTENG